MYTTFAGMGGSNKFIKGEVDSAWYFPIGITTVMLRGRLGYAVGLLGEELPLYERFYVGGIYTVRGLGYGDAGPKDSDGDDPIGGTEELIFNTEYIFPLISEIRLKGSSFLMREIHMKISIILATCDILQDWEYDGFRH